MWACLLFHSWEVFPASALSNKSCAHATSTLCSYWMSREKYMPSANVNSLAMANSWSNNSVGLFAAAIHGSPIAVNESFPERTLQASRHIICTSEMKFSPRSLRWFCIHVKAVLEATSAAAHNFFPLIVEHGKLQAFKNNKLNLIWIIIKIFMIFLRAKFAHFSMMMLRWNAATTTAERHVRPSRWNSFATIFKPGLISCTRQSHSTSY